jgi:hypothetical protein
MGSEKPETLELGALGLPGWVAHFHPEYVDVIGPERGAYTRYSSPMSPVYGLNGPAGRAYALARALAALGLVEPKEGP